MRKTKRVPKSAISAKMNSRVKKRGSSVMARKIVIAGIVISSVMVILSVVVAVFFNDEMIAHRKFEKIAKEYYENYYYPKFIETLSPEVYEQRMEIYSKTGLQPATLRQLLLYQNGKNSAYKKYFEKEHFSCDKNETSARFYPVAPYGTKDYTVEFKYTCQTE
ncbi:hypothetical protein IKF63_01905 [Candidatus Saccharibacteria bacterium]|nr:hypothetical protein [Candidatus Saccharibacteria bacterium]